MRMESPALLRKALLVLLVIPGVCGCWIERRPAATGGDTDSGPPDRSDNLWARVSSALDSSAAAWNRGDLSGFLAPYRASTTTTYIGAPGLVVGHRALRQRYAPYFEPGARRDSLRFADLSTRPLGEGHALATGRWMLHRGGRVTSHGYFSLVLRRVEGEWKIVHDHSSQAAEDEGDSGAGASPDSDGSAGHGSADTP